MRRPTTLLLLVAALAVVGLLANLRIVTVKEHMRLGRRPDQPNTVDVETITKSWRGVSSVHTYKDADPSQIFAHAPRTRIAFSGPSFEESMAAAAIANSKRYKHETHHVEPL